MEEILSESLPYLSCGDVVNKTFLEQLQSLKSLKSLKFQKQPSRCPEEKVSWKYAANLQEKTHAKV